MKYKDTCQHCGNDAVAYTHVFSAALVNVFLKFVDYYKGLEKPRPVNVNTEIAFNHNELAAFRKLKFFGLVIKTNDNGYWLPTQFAVDFYYGRNTVTTPVATINDKLIDDTHAAWTTHKASRKAVFIDSLLPAGYKRRPEYKAERSPQMSMND